MRSLINVCIIVSYSSYLNDAQNLCMRGRGKVARHHITVMSAESDGEDNTIIVHKTTLVITGIQFSSILYILFTLLELNDFCKD